MRMGPSFAQYLTFSRTILDLFTTQSLGNAHVVKVMGYLIISPILPINEHPPVPYRFFRIKFNLLLFLIPASSIRRCAHAVTTADGGMYTNFSSFSFGFGFSWQ